MYYFESYKNVRYELNYCDFMDRWEYDYSDFYEHNGNNHYISGRGHGNTKSEAIRKAESDIDDEIRRLD